MLEEQTAVFPEIIDDDGFPCDDLAKVSHWVAAIFEHYTHHALFEVTHCNISSYGASLVHLDKDGEWLKPFYNYLKPFPDQLKEKFQAAYGQLDTISAITASPFLGLLNSGLQLYWLKYAKPEMFEKVDTCLHLPQYFTYVLTGKTYADFTSVGCHTMLWDFQRQDYHAWVDEENLRQLFPSLHAASHTFAIQQGESRIQMGIGVHDSSAALMPYLATQQDPFLLLSTGTWNICFNPFNVEPLTKKELSADCLCFLTPTGLGTPIKASRIFLGHEHDVQTTAMAKFFKVQPNYYQSIGFDESVFNTLTSLRKGDKVFYPLGMEGTGPIPEKQIQHTDYSAFDNFDEAYHQLIRYLVKWQIQSIELIDPLKQIRNIIVVGGFTKNPLFLEMLKRMNHDRKVHISDHPRASALGAAWLVAGEEAYRENAGILKVTEI